MVDKLHMTWFSAARGGVWVRDWIWRLRDTPQVRVSREIQSRGKRCQHIDSSSKWSLCPVHRALSASAPGPRSGKWRVCVECLTSVSACFFSPLLTGPGEQLGGACLLGIGIWVMVDPTGFREIVAANPLLITGAYILLAMGGLLFLLGFLGCCGAVRENKCLLLLVSTPSSTPPMGAPGWVLGALCPHYGGLTLRSEPSRPSSRSGRTTSPSYMHLSLDPCLPCG